MSARRHADKVHRPSRWLEAGVKIDIFTGPQLTTTTILDYHVDANPNKMHATRDTRIKLNKTACAIIISLPSSRSASCLSILFHH
eukprot:scaffold153938_cov23-Cyclotella_meneghiniana.AAC.1